MTLVVSWGGGVNSTAMIVELLRVGIRPDLILFAEPPSGRCFRQLPTPLSVARVRPGCSEVRAMSGIGHQPLDHLKSLIFRHMGGVFARRQPQDKGVSDFRVAPISVGDLSEYDSEPEVDGHLVVSSTKQPLAYVPDLSRIEDLLEDILTELRKQ